MKISEEQKEKILTYARDNQCKYGLGCSEAVFNAFIRAGVVDLPEEYTCLTSALPGGVGASGNTCGAIFGAVMAIGAIYGRKDPRSTPFDPTKPLPVEKDYRYTIGRRYNLLVNEFEKIWGTTRCGDIIERTGGYFSDERIKQCPDMIVSAAELAIKYIEMDEEELAAIPFGKNIFGWEGKDGK